MKSNNSPYEQYRFKNIGKKKTSLWENSVGEKFKMCGKTLLGKNLGGVKNLGGM